MIRSRRKQGAFTLLEMIVVLLVVSFIGTLLMQGLSYASKANQSLHQNLGRGQVRALTFDWFRDAVENLVAPEAGEVRWRLRGDELSFEAMSAAALDRRAGIPTPLAFRLERRAGEDRTELIYVRRLEDSRWPSCICAAKLASAIWTVMASGTGTGRRARNWPIPFPRRWH